jgi:hypothetical protein
MTQGASLVQSPIASLPARSAPFSAAAPVMDGEEENGREKDCSENCIARLASFHLSGIVRAPNIARIRIICRENMSHNGGTALVFFKTGTIEMP